MEPAKPITDAAEPRSTRRRFRFSLLTILLVTTIVGLSLAYFRSRSELLDAQAKLREVRQNYDVIDVQDDTKIYVRPMKVPADNMWQWRVYLPEGDRYHIKFDYNSIPPKTPKPATRSNLTLSPGMYVITQMFVFDPDSTTPVWKFHLSATSPYGDVRNSGVLPRKEVSWLEAKYIGTGQHLLPETEDGEPRRTVAFNIDPLFGEAVPARAYQQTTHEHDEEVELLRWEVDEPLNPVGQEPVDYLPLEVFRLWIERVTPPKVSGNVMPCPLVRNDSLGEQLRRTIDSNGSHHP